MVEEVLGWGEIAKGLVRSCVIEAMGEGVDTELEGFEAGREVFDAVELVSPRALGELDVAVELGPLRRQDEEAQVALLACVLELGPELRPAIDLDALDAEGDLGDELVAELRQPVLFETNKDSFLSDEHLRERSSALPRCSSAVATSMTCGTCGAARRAADGDSANGRG